MIIDRLSLRTVACAVLAALALIQLPVAAHMVAAGVAPGVASGAAEANEPMLVVRNTADPDQPEVGLSEAELLDMRQVTVRTSTEFTDGVVEFVGPLARDAVALVGAEGASTVHLVAVNDYSVDVALEEIMNYDVILALYADGKRLIRRGKGPIWLMYPIDAYEELQDADYNRRLIWQLDTLELR